MATAEAIERNIWVRRAILSSAVAVGVAVLIWVVLAVVDTNRARSRVDRAAAQLVDVIGDSGADVRVVDVSESGTFFCVISCSEYRVTILVASDRLPDVLCEVFENATTAVAGLVERPEYVAGCEFEGPVPGVRGGFIRAWASPSDSPALGLLLAESAVGADGWTGPTAGQLVVSSGVD